MAMGGPGRRRLRATATPLLKAKPRRRLRITEVTVAIAALLLSASAFIGNALLYLRGSTMAVLPPDKFVLYRDTGPNGSDLYLAVPVSIINAASPDFGDVVTRATASISSQEGSPGGFAYEAVVEPVVTSQVERGVENCTVGARCIPAVGFYAVESPARLLDIPGGASRTQFMSFWLSSENCTGATSYCSRFKSFENGVAALRQEAAPVITVDIEFYFDGHRSVECALPAAAPQRTAIFDYLVQKGWAMPACAPAGT